MSTSTLLDETGTATSPRFRTGIVDSDAAETPMPNGILPSPPASILEKEPGEASPSVSTAQSQLTKEPGQGFPRASTAQSQETIEDVAPLIRLTGGQSPARRFKVLQQWEGIVSDVNTDSLMADLVDLTDPSKPREIAEIPLAEIPEADHHLLLPGCVFYWIIGYQTSPGGQKSRVSEIRIRRNPKWSQHAIDSIKARGKQLYQRLKGGSEGNTASSK